MCAWGGSIVRLVSMIRLRLVLQFVGVGARDGVANIARERRCLFCAKYSILRRRQRRAYRSECDDFLFIRDWFTVRLLLTFSAPAARGISVGV